MMLDNGHFRRKSMKEDNMYDIGHIYSLLNFHTI
jgi:hypothetical protein